MSHAFIPIIARYLNLPEWKVENTLALFEDGATIPFIARYRQERTGGLDELEIGEVEKQKRKLEEVDKRRESILASIAEQGKLSEELKLKIEQSWSLTELEDLYLPYKPKRKTKASVARQKNLEPLAGSIMKQDLRDLEGFALRFVKGEVASVEEALEGARYIMAEWISERPKARNTVRRIFAKKAFITAKVVKGKEEEAEKYRDYFSFSEPLKKIPSHRLLALRRGESEGFLKVSIAPDADEVLDSLERIFIKADNEAADQVAMAAKDAYKRLLQPSIETEFKNESKEKADDQAINVFTQNLRQLLLTPPVGQKRTLAIDPGFKSGCKVVCLDEQGQLLHNENIYPHPPQNERNRAASKINQLVEAYKLEAIAIGNGTAGRETEDFIRRQVRFKQDVAVYVVNEAGASVYSASSVGRAEFPNYDVTVRGAISIGRRLMDPLAELVKIDPKSIGVGQYQHDVDQKKLQQALDQTVVSVVNQVGVEINTASSHLLRYVSGLSTKMAENIIDHRNENGPFSNREEFKKVKGLGPKAFEQCAGFLRIADARNPLDNSAVHPESYVLAEQMAQDQGGSVRQLVGNRERLQSIDLQRYVKGDTGLPTLQNIVKELGKIGRDPRGKTQMFNFDPNLRRIEDLKEGMIVPGIVSNITNFGAFVDVGVKQDGLVHVSQLADRFVSDPNEVVRLQQQVKVKVLSVDIPRKRIQLSMKEAD